MSREKLTRTPSSALAFWRASLDVFQPIANFEGGIEGLTIGADAGVDRVCATLKVSSAVKWMLHHAFSILAVSFGHSVSSAVGSSFPTLLEKGVRNRFSRFQSAPTEWGFGKILKLVVLASLVACGNVFSFGPYGFSPRSSANGGCGRFVFLAADYLSLYASPRVFFAIGVHAEGLVLIGVVLFLLE